MPTLIDTTSLVKFGNMASGGGLAAAVNTGDAGSTGYNQATSGYAGVTLATPSKIVSVDVTSATNGFDASGLTTGITLYLYGKQGAAPTSQTNGTLLGSISFTDVNATTVKTITSNDQNTVWDHVWVRGQTGVWTVFESLKFYSPDPEIPPEHYTPPEPVLQTATRAIYTRSDNVGTPLKSAGEEVYEFRIDVHVNAAAVAKIHFHADIVHRGDITGYNDVVGIGFAPGYYFSSTHAGLETATLTYIVPSGGCNIINRNPDHYGQVDIVTAMNLQAGYYRFTVFGRAGTTAIGWTNTDGLAGILSESGHGLNKLVVDVDYSADLINT